MGCACCDRPCLGAACPNNDSEIYCEECKDHTTEADYEIEGDYLCEECAKKRLLEDLRSSGSVEGMCDLLEYECKNLRERRYDRTICR